MFLFHSHEFYVTRNIVQTVGIKCWRDLLTGSNSFIADAGACDRVAHGEQDRGYRRTRSSALTSPVLPTGEAQWISGNDLPFLWSPMMPGARRDGQECGAPAEDVQVDEENEDLLRL